MPNAIPAPIAPATATTSGVVSTGAQVLGAGQKTFSQPGINTPSIVLPGGAGGFGYGGGLQIGSSFNAVQNEGTGFYLQSYGAGNPAELRSFQTFAIVSGRMEGTIASGEIAVKIGTRRPDANVDLASKLVSFRTAIGGTETEKAWITGTGGIAGTGTPGTIGGNLTPGQGWALGSYNVNIGSAALWLGTSNPTLTDFTLATSSSGGLSTPVGTTLRGSAIHVRGNNGTVSGDKVVSLGTMQADGSVNAGAKLLSLATGLGGTEVEKAYIRKDGGAQFGGSVYVGPWVYNGIPSAGLIYDSGSATIGIGNAASGVYLGLNIGNGATFSISSFTAAGGLYTTNGVLASGLGALSTDVAIKVGTTTADGSVNAAAKLFSVRTGIGGTEVEKLYTAKDGTLWSNTGRLGSFSSANVYVWCDSGAARLYYAGATLEVTADTAFNNGTTYSWRITNAGRFDQSGTDSSGTPGAATINKPTGISAIASGTNTVTITNSLATATSRIMISWLGDHGAARSWVNRSAGAFTVVLPTNATANTAFAWEVSSLL